MRAFFYKSSDKQTISNSDQVVGRLALPPGNYIILGEASVAETTLGTTMDFSQPVECKLKAGTIEDKVMLNLRSGGSKGGNWGVIALIIGVKFDGGTAELTCSQGKPGLSVFDVELSAMQVDELPISEGKPSTNHTPNWYINNSRAWHYAFAPLTQMPRHGLDRGKY